MNLCSVSGGNCAGLTVRGLMREEEWGLEPGDSPVISSVTLAKFLLKSLNLNSGCISDEA